MPRPRTSTAYVERVATLAAEGHRIAAIHKVIEGEARKAGLNDYPSERTVRRLHEAFEQQPEHVRREAALLRWPQSMQSGALPWEASRACLDLLAHCLAHNLGRPTIRHAKWFWRLRLADPTIQPVDAHLYGAFLALLEFADQIKVTVRAETEPLERLLAFQPRTSVNAWPVLQMAAARDGVNTHPRLGLAEFRDAEAPAERQVLMEWGRLMWGERLQEILGRADQTATPLPWQE